MQEEHDTKLMKSFETICEQCLQNSLNVSHRCKICHKESNLNGAIIYESKKYKGKKYNPDNPCLLCLLLLMIPIMFALMIFFCPKDGHCKY